jgi:hypothetical protein
MTGRAAWRAGHLRRARDCHDAVGDQSSLAEPWQLGEPLRRYHLEQNGDLEAAARLHEQLGPPGPPSCRRPVSTAARVSSAVARRVGAAGRRPDLRGQPATAAGLLSRAAERAAELAERLINSAGVCACGWSMGARRGAGGAPGRRRAGRVAHERLGQFQPAAKPTNARPRCRQRRPDRRGASPRSTSVRRCFTSALPDTRGGLPRHTTLPATCVVVRARRTGVCRV